MLERLGPLPADFVFVEGQRGALACRGSDREALRRAGFTPDGRRDEERLADAEESGREALGRLVVGGTEALVRRFTHGGLARAVTGRRFKDPARPFEELRLSEQLRALGVPTPRVIAARAVRAAGPGFELSLVIERVHGTIDIGRLMGDVRAGRAPKSALRRAVVDAGALVGRRHGAGFLHADLQPANLLVERSGARGAIVLDLDRSRFTSQGPLPDELVVVNLARLWRHVRRREQRYGEVLTPGDRALFLASYGVARGDVEDLAARIDLAADRAGIAHRLGWWLESRVGRGEDARAR
ncbi:MAG: lipopolysaccharide kinase InaA family protein [Planctomycetota bacterium]|nr:lipopolysaccharide kinase InaA family protein [Planctomycetota bacterium]